MDEKNILFLQRFSHRGLFKKNAAPTGLAGNSVTKHPPTPIIL